jgi:hydrogenase expression/formation protein HypC
MIKSVDGLSAEVEFGEVTRQISIWLTPDVKPGEYVLVHTGYSINVIDEKEAMETLSLFEEVAEGLDAEASAEAA